MGTPMDTRYHVPGKQPELRDRGIEQFSPSQHVKGTNSADFLILDF